MADDVSRRAAILGGAAVASGGLNPRPMNAPPAEHLRIGVQAGGTPGVLIGHTVLVFGPAGSVVGVFVYATGTTPGPGNSPVSWITNQIQDPYGNIVVPNLGAANTADNSVSTLGGDGLQTQVAGHVWAQLQAVAATATFYLHTTAFATLIADPIIAVLPSSSPAAAETWHNLTVAAGFANGSPAPQYRLMPDNTVMLTGAVNLTANQAAGATWWNIPAGYQTARTALQLFNPVNNLSGGNGITISASPATTAVLNQAGTSGNFFLLDGIRYSLT